MSECAYLGWVLQRRGGVARTNAEGTRIPERKEGRIPGRKTTDNVEEEIAPDDKSNWCNWGKKGKEGEEGAPGRKTPWGKF